MKVIVRIFDEGDLSVDTQFIVHADAEEIKELLASKFAVEPYSPEPGSG